jgi:molybdopterin synthase catalytic subunit
MRADIVDRAIDVAAITQELAASAHGAVSVFIGTIRDENESRVVTGLEYSAYEPMANSELNAIVREASARFGTQAIIVEHRVGALRVGDISLAIAAAHARRGNAMDATRYVVEQLKQRVPIWKLEHYADGVREWVDPTQSAQRSAAV